MCKSGLFLPTSRRRYLFLETRDLADSLPCFFRFRQQPDLMPRPTSRNLLFSFSVLVRHEAFFTRNLDAVSQAQKFCECQSWVKRLDRLLGFRLSFERKEEKKATGANDWRDRQLRMPPNESPFCPITGQQEDKFHNPAGLLETNDPMI